MLKAGGGVRGETRLRVMIGDIPDHRDYRVQYPIFDDWIGFDMNANDLTGTVLAGCTYLWVDDVSLTQANPPVEPEACENTCSATDGPVILELSRGRADAREKRGSTCMKVQFFRIRKGELR